MPTRHPTPPAVPASLALVLLAAAPPALSCERAPALMALHEGVRALDAPGTPSERRQAASALQTLTRETDVLLLASSLNANSVPVDAARLAEGFAHGAELAEMTLSGQDIAGAQNSPRHARNLAHMADVLGRAGCQAAPARAATASSGGSGLGGDQAPDSQESASLAADALPFDLGRSLMALGVAILIGAAVAAVILWRRTLIFRTAQVERLPRYPISVAVLLEFDDPLRAPSTATAIDVSQGGMKLAINEALPPGTRVWIDDGDASRIPAEALRATVAWSNPFYCGVVFDRMITSDQIRRYEVMTRDAAA